MERKQVDVRELIARLNANERLRSHVRFSHTVYRDEPIITTGRQMANYLPDQYREMRAISRYQDDGKRKRWLSEAELFYRQARFMEDCTDDCPYHGRFVAYYPTYLAMSDRQLRGYFTWRTAVRAGDVQDTSLSFAYVYIYELLNGIGVTSPLDGFEKLRAFWQTFRAFAPELDRYLPVWLRDYVVYHALDPVLLTNDQALEQDRALLALMRVSAPFDEPIAQLLAERGVASCSAIAAPRAASATSGRSLGPALPLPPQVDAEEQMLAAIDELSTYRLTRSKLYREHPDDVRHVACAVFVRMLAYHRKNRAHGLIESSFGEEAELSYTMFGSAVFFEERKHPDSVFTLDPMRSFRCHEGLWTCTRFYGGTGPSRELGDLMHAVDQLLREALGFDAPLKERKTPQYLKRIIKREITTWLSWKEAHAPRTITIDLSKLSGIRSAAAKTRDALLIDEEREEDEVTPQEPDAPTGVSGPLNEAERAFVEALLAGEKPAIPRGATMDMLVDAVNEALFDELGDSALEFDVTGPHIIDDYRDEIRRLIAS